MEVERLIDHEGWPVDGLIDRQKKYTALTLACHLDHLEIVHLLDLKGANISAPAGKHQNSPLMAATMRWNVRIVDYLLTRNVDPNMVDEYGFTAKKKA